MQTHEIRKRFLDHFVKAGHTEVPSASVILDDPNLLFVNAGMVQFVPFFLGQRTPPYETATSIQKCIRTPDIDEVGHHHPAQHVLSDGRQFLLRRLFQARRHRIGLDAADQPGRRGRLRLRSRNDSGPQFICDDDEAAKLWQEVAGLPPERIQRRGMADNYWSMGIPGPCGPSLGDLLRPRPGVRPRGRPAGQRRALHRDLESRVHAERARRRHQQGRLPRSSGRCRARTSTPAWASSGSPCCCRACTTSTRPICCARSSTWWPRARPRLRRRQPRRRRALPDHRRPQPHRGDPDRRRRQPRQRGPRLRAAPAAAPGDPLGQAARHRASRSSAT